MGRLRPNEPLTCCDVIHGAVPPQLCCAVRCPTVSPTIMPQRARPARPTWADEILGKHRADQRIQPSRLMPRRNRRPAARSYFRAGHLPGRPVPGTPITHGSPSCRNTTTSGSSSRTAASVPASRSSRRSPRPAGGPLPRRRLLAQRPELRDQGTRSFADRRFRSAPKDERRGPFAAPPHCANGSHLATLAEPLGRCQASS